MLKLLALIAVRCKALPPARFDILQCGHKCVFLRYLCFSQHCMPAAHLRCLDRHPLRSMALTRRSSHTQSANPLHTASQVCKTMDVHAQVAVDVRGANERFSEASARAPHILAPTVSSAISLQASHWAIVCTELLDCKVRFCFLACKHLLLFFECHRSCHHTNDQVLVVDTRVRPTSIGS